MEYLFRTREKDELEHLNRLKTDFKYFFAHVCEPAFFGDQTTFKYSRGFEVMSEYLVCFLDGDIRRLTVSIPPRNSKSLIWSCALPMFEWLSKPNETFLSIAHHDSLLQQFQTSRKSIFEQKDYQRLINWECTVNTKETLRNNQSGHVLSMVMAFIRTGLGANTLVFDDPISAVMAQNIGFCEKIIGIFTGAAMSRLNDKKSGKVAVISQRLADGDMIGYLQDKGYEHLILQAIADEPQVIHFPLSGKEWVREVGDVLNPEYEPLETLLELKALDPQTFYAQYQQKPVTVGNSVLSFEDIVRYEQPETEYNNILLSVDSAATKGRQSAAWGLIVAGIYTRKGVTAMDILYVYAQKMDYVEGKKKINEICAKYKVDQLMIESKSTGLALIPELKAEGNYVIDIPAVKSKEERAMQSLAFIKQGRVRLPDTDKLPFTENWVNIWLHQHIGFPVVKLRDVLDAQSQLSIYYASKTFDARAFYSRYIRDN